MPRGGGQQVEANHWASKTALLRRLSSAQQSIEEHIFDDSIGLSPYRQGSHPYDRTEHLSVVTDHIRGHHWHVVGAPDSPEGLNRRRRCRSRPPVTRSYRSPLSESTHEHRPLVGPLRCGSDR
jgi:hypothetical protein